MQRDHKRMVWLACIIVAGCSGAMISLDHYQEGLGLTPPIPERGGSGPKLVEVAIDDLPGDVTIPTQLPQLIEAYRRKLLMMAHPLPPEQAQHYADTEIAILRRKSPTDQAFAQALTQRLRPSIGRPGRPGEVQQHGPIYPPDDPVNPTQERTPS